MHKTQNQSERPGLQKVKRFFSNLLKLKLSSLKNLLLDIFGDREDMINFWSFAHAFILNFSGLREPGQQ